MENNWVKKRLAIGIILLFVGTCILPGIAQETEKLLTTSRGNWLYVGGSGPGNYTRIQEAINDSKFGDTVYVYDESSPYNEFLVINKTISLVGENKDTTIVKGYNKIQRHVIQINANGIHLRGFTIQNSTFINDDVEPYFGIAITSNNNDISENILTNNAGGILTSHASRNKIHGNIIKNDTHYCVAITVEYGVNNEIFNNSISRVGCGVGMLHSAFNKVHGNRFTHIRYDGVLIGKTLPWCLVLYNRIYENYFSGAENGIHLVYWCCFNFVYRNEITNCSQNGILRVFTLCTFIMDNNFMNNSRNAYFYESFIMNKWSRNYWDDWNGSGYYAIDGEDSNLMDPENGPIPVHQYDRHPVIRPYDIPEMG
jgi:parallel beta-helix repeat protein